MAVVNNWQKSIKLTEGNVSLIKVREFLNLELK